MAASSVSTVIATYQGARFLPEAIESALAQDHSPHQIIVVDDGSTDGTAELESRYPSVTWITHPENRGVAAARNSALAVATGEFIAILDSDDVMAPHRVATQVARLLAEPRLGIVLGLQEVFLEEGATLPDWAQDKPLLNWRDDGPDAPYYAAASGMLRASALEQIGDYDETLRIGEDLDLIFRLGEAGYEIGTIEEISIRRRAHGGNLTGADESVIRSLPEVLSRRIARKRAAAQR